jgi:hypothetical protein
VLADLARRLQRQADLESVMQIVVAAVLGTVSLLHNRRRVLSAAFANERARRFDELGPSGPHFRGAGPRAWKRQDRPGADSPHRSGRRRRRVARP